ncbi:MAG: pyridoxal-phosphate dependent enzyme, partial [bacterium]
MSTIIKHLNHEVVKKTAARCRQRDITIPTFAQMRNPETIPATIRARLKGVGLWDVNPVNLFRITWKNDISTGMYGGVNFVEIPKEITGVKARIIGLVGKYFPTGAHKVGAAFGCLVPRLVSGEFDPEKHKAVWPSTGNFCRGGAFDCALLDCTPIAILPEEMSKERFAWLKEIGAEVIATPGCESNVKEIYDKCWELKKDPNNIIFNQFEEFGNPIWHYNVTGPAIEEVFQGLHMNNGRVAAYISATGSAGTIAAGDYLKTKYPHLKIVASEALQCPTLLM